MTIAFLLVLVAFLLAVAATIGVNAGRFSLLAAAIALGFAAWLTQLWP